MKINKGELAKNFTVKDIYYNRIKLSNGKRYVNNFTFYKNANCPFTIWELIIWKQWVKHLRIIRLPYIDIRKFTWTIYKKCFSSKHFTNTINWRPWAQISSIIYWVNIYNKDDKNIYYYWCFWSNLKAKKLDLSIEKDSNARSNRIPADILINNYLFIEETHYGEHQNNHMPLTKIKSFVEQ